MRSQSFPLVMVLALSGCFQPNPDKVTITCVDNSPGQCPDGQSCTGGMCVVPDLATPNDSSASGVDQSTLPPDMSALAGCKNGGAKPIDSASCDSVPNFFAADQAAYWMGTMPQETCGTAIFNQLLYGCGAAGRAGAKNCGGFKRVIDLGSGWSSANGTLAQAANTNPMHGVVCCKAGAPPVGCPGAFATGQAAQQCASGYTPCLTLP